MKATFTPAPIIPPPSKGDVHITMTHEEAEQLRKFLGQGSVKATGAHIAASSNHYGLIPQAFHEEVIYPLYCAIDDAVG